MINNWFSELLHSMPKAAEVLPLFSTTNSLPAPEIQGIEYSQPCEIAKLNEDGSLKVLALPARLRFADQQWTKDSVSRENLDYPATHWRFNS